MMQTKDMQTFLATEFPQSTVQVLSLGDRTASVRQEINNTHLRPGGTVSGPVLMTVADVAMYVAVLNQIGIVPLATALIGYCPAYRLIGLNTCGVRKG